MADDDKRIRDIETAIAIAGNPTLDDLNAIYGLRANINWLISELRKARAEINNLMSANKFLEGRIRQLEAVKKAAIPFSKLLQSHQEYLRDESPIFEIAGAVILKGDLRRLVEALTACERESDDIPSSTPVRQYPITLDITKVSQGSPTVGEIEIEREAANGKE